MKIPILKSLIVCWLFITSGYLSAHEGLPKDCGDSCFQTQVQSVTETEGGCLKYTLLVTNNGSCAHALSHYAVSIPCGSVSSITNSEGWNIEVGTDPKSGITGFKVDNINGFGENGQAGDFTVEFTLCPENETCSASLNCWAPEVAYKAATCIFYEQTEISCSQLSAHIETNDVSCFGLNDGSAEVVIEEGEAPFTYQWSNGSSTAQNTNLSAGEYSVTITDSNGESVTLTALINQPGALNTTANVNSASCSGSNNGSISVDVTGGTAPYTYQWSNGATTASISNLSAGYYELDVTDSRGCSVKVPAVVENLTTINLTAAVEKTSCSGNTGSINITVTGGSEPYTFAWSNGSTSEDISRLAAGVYNVQVTDANGCSSSRSFIVKENNPLDLSAIPSPTSCIEDNSGSIDLMVSGGTEPYTYSWSDGSTTEDLSGLAKGIYSVTVTEAGGCSATLRVSVVAETFQVSTDSQNPTCMGADGYIQVTPLGGQSPYTYLWSNGGTTAEISGLSSGMYDVTVTDATGCSRKLYFYLTEPDPLTLSAEIENLNCVEGEFSLDLTVTGGTGPYDYNWLDESTLEDRTGLTSGSYIVTVTDVNGCSVAQEFIIDANSAGCPDLNNPGDNGTNDGSDNGTDDGSDTGTDDGSDTGTDDGTDNGTNDGSDNGTDDGGDSGADGGEGTDGSGDGDGTDGDNGGNDGTDNGGDADGGSDDGDGSDSDGDNGSGNDGSCNNPFDTDIVLVSVDGNCYTYTATVEYSGSHSYGLSHLSIAVPECASIAEVSNSEHWKIEYGTDPRTGLSGFKVDDINNFGEGGFGDSFTIDFTVCTSDNQCAYDLSGGTYTIGYKYGQCVSFETVDVESDNQDTEVLAYPNPFSETTRIEFVATYEGSTTVELYNQRGERVSLLFEGQVNKGSKYSFDLNAAGLPNDIYTYKVTTPGKVYRGKLLLTR
ncbi:T9SS type A sorting domain-containing protein [Fulvivirga sp. 29W222]|uniref:T9SS type A sorting domain-containing protein n=1 Tax=Fulvivirga marina TaxID=2494733 RepID=A0A937KBF3_9BACT|nr:T9SS type A sorting domain-containing protein [Fulvivirga marina]MBL6446042.1 T9SS type A sorting domain-containing protein [Fulvivirga marina]